MEKNTGSSFREKISSEILRLYGDVATRACLLEEERGHFSPGTTILPNTIRGALYCPSLNPDPEALDKAIAEAEAMLGLASEQR